ncbi:hypothetical protein SAY87_017547 [Trapa incisa]|uniref:Uncharacterized protein n=1 Tax=Trapa incisa TaxID=236973 RepID=A0AAN7L2M0_9MYRT|nr:hypothetical protein SAY87_017547 [Trapa incisa]
MEQTKAEKKKRNLYFLLTHFKISINFCILDCRYALGWRGGKWYANRKFKREQMKLLGQIKPKRWQLLSQVKPKGWKLQFLKRPLSRSRAPESAHKTISEGSVC